MSPGITVDEELVLSSPWNGWLFPFSQCTVAWVNGHSSLWGRMTGIITLFTWRMLQASSSWGPSHLFGHQIPALKIDWCLRTEQNTVIFNRGDYVLPPDFVHLPSTISPIKILSILFKGPVEIPLPLWLHILMTLVRMNISILWTPIHTWSHSVLYYIYLCIYSTPVWLYIYAGTVSYLSFYYLKYPT